jgi:hypothetical protein
MVVRLQDMAAQGDLPELGQKPAAEGMQVKEEVTADSVGPVVVILVLEGVQADTPVQVATAAMVVVFHMGELLVWAVLAVAVVVQLFPHHQEQVEVSAFKAKEEMAVAAVKVQILDTEAVAEAAPVVAMV